MSTRSNLFANIENQFEFASKEEITEIAQSSIRELFSAIASLPPEAKFGVVCLGVRLGVAGDGVLNQDEKNLIDAVLGIAWKGPMSQLYDMVSGEISEDNYETVELLNELGNEVAMPFLYFTLSFAYIDGKIEDEVANRLDSLFGMNLLTAFMQSGEEEVPTPKIRITELEAEIVSWFQEEDRFCNVKEIQKHFPDRTEAEIQEAMDDLYEKGIVYGGKDIVGGMYALT